MALPPRAPKRKASKEPGTDESQSSQKRERFEELDFEHPVPTVFWLSYLRNNRRKTDEGPPFDATPEEQHRRKALQGRALKKYFDTALADCAGCVDEQLNRGAWSMFIRDGTAVAGRTLVCAKRYKKITRKAYGMRGKAVMLQQLARTQQSGDRLSEEQVHNVTKYILARIEHARQQQLIEAEKCISCVAKGCLKCAAIIGDIVAH